MALEQPSSVSIQVVNIHLRGDESAAVKIGRELHPKSSILEHDGRVLNQGVADEHAKAFIVPVRFSSGDLAMIAVQGRGGGQDYFRVGAGRGARGGAAVLR